MPRAPSSPEFQFSRSTATSPRASAPSSPKPFGNPDEYYYSYTSAPASPTRATAVYSYFAGDIDEWEEKPMAPKSRGNEFDFALGLGGAEHDLSTADELFHNGRISATKPHPPPRLDLPPISPIPSSRGLWSPRGGGGRSSLTTERGRERAPLSPSGASSRSRRESRSVSPLREEASYRSPIASPSASPSPSAAAPCVKGSGSKKWRYLKDLLLFRSASEGRATGRRSKDPLWKYTLLSVSFNKSRPSVDAKSSGSFKSTDSSNSSIKRGSSGPAVLQYTANRAALQEQKKKTPLPYHQNTLFGCLLFNPAVRSVARGFNSKSFNRSQP